MRRVLLDITTSLDGFIADRDGGIGWILPPPTQIPADYLDLMATVDTLVMGRVTYEVSLGLPGGTEIFVGKHVYVITSRLDLSPREGVEFVSHLKERSGGTIWLFGGGLLATALSAAGLVDDYLIVIQPILLGDGIPLWQGGSPSREVELVDVRPWSDGLAELRYRRRE